jgi:hypothetical protein
LGPGLNISLTQQTYLNGFEKMKEIINELPSLENDAAYCAAKEKLTALQVSLLTAESKRNAILADLNSPRPGSNPLRDAAMLLLNGDANSPLPVAAIIQLRESYKDLTSRIDVIRAAIQIQRDIVERLVVDASKLAGEKMKPLHRELVGNVVEKLKLLNTALTAEYSLRDSLFQAGFSTTHEIRPMQLPAIGLLSNEWSRASLYLLEAYREGFIPLDELPENLQRQIVPDTPAKAGKLAAAVHHLDGWLLAG